MNIANESVKNKIKIDLGHTSKRKFIAGLIDKINKNILNGNPTIPSILEDELECNIFLRSDNIEIQKQLGINGGDPIEAFAKLRDLKDNF